MHASSARAPGVAGPAIATAPRRTPQAPAEQQEDARSYRFLRGRHQDGRRVAQHLDLRLNAGQEVHLDRQERKARDQWRYWRDPAGTC